jgi:hypothetical protein
MHLGLECCHEGTVRGERAKCAVAILVLQLGGKVQQGQHHHARHRRASTLAAAAHDPDQCVLIASLDAGQHPREAPSSGAFLGTVHLGPAARFGGEQLREVRLSHNTVMFNEL